MKPITFSFRTYRSRRDFLLSQVSTGALKLLDVGNLGVDEGASSFRELQKLIEGNGGTYVGLDCNENLTKELNLPNQFIGDIHATPFQDGEFDAIYAGEVLEHTWTPQTLLQECRRILKPGGRLILDTPNPYAILALIRFVFFRKDWMGDDRKQTYVEAKSGVQGLIDSKQLNIQPQHKIFYTPAMLKQLLETQGFVMESIGATYKPWNAVHALLLKLFPHTGPQLCVVGRKATVDEAFADVA